MLKFLETVLEVGGDKLVCEPNMSVATIKQNVTDAVIKKGETVIADAENVSTGCTITTAGNIYTVIVLGDINGDGKVTSTDLLVVKRLIAGVISTVNPYLNAADINSSGSMTAADLLLIKQAICGLISL